MNNKYKKNKICLELIKLINENFIEDIEIQKKLNIKNAVFKKNLYYLKKAGLKIIRKNNKYKLINYKNLIEIKPHEISILAYLMSLGENFFSYDKSQLLNSTLDKVLYFSNEKTHQKKYIFSIIFSYWPAACFLPDAARQKSRLPRAPIILSFR